MRHVDWSGMKFLIAEEMGETMDVIYHRYDSERPDNDELFVVNHKFYDGVGGFTKTLEHRDQFTYSELPGFKLVPSLSLWQKLKKLWQFIQLTKPVRIQWKRRVDRTGRAPGHAVAFIPREVVEEIEASLKVQKQVMNARIFWAVDQMACLELLEPGSERKWVSPVNMRGAVVVDNPLGNVAASVILNFKDEVTAQEINKDMRDYFKERLYMGSWLYTNMVRFIGLWGTRIVAKKIKDLGVGVVSNMGPWPVTSFQTDQSIEALNWAGVPPASQVLPVSSGIIQWDKQLAISLMIHPSLDCSLERTEELLKVVLENIHTGLSSRAIIRTVNAIECDARALRLA
jgi:hypothetical protein